jgi:sulfur carrier protein
LEIFVNGESRKIQNPCSARQLLEDMGLLEQRLALEINEEIVSKSRHAEHFLSEGDKIEIVNAIGGG